MVVLYRDFLLLVGYTGRVFDLLELIENVQQRATEEIAAARDPQEFEDLEMEIEPNTSSDSLSEHDSYEDDGAITKRNGVEVGRYIEGDHIQFDNVSVVTPDGMSLIEGMHISLALSLSHTQLHSLSHLIGLSFDLPTGQNLLISGPNGISKLFS